MTRRNTGSLVVNSLFAALAVLVFIYSLAMFLKISGRQTLYLDQMNRATAIAEAGLNEALGRLTLDPNILVSKTVSSSFGDGQTETFIYYPRILPNHGACYYFVTTATRTIRGGEFISRLHTYAKISNTGDYFAAFSEYGKITDGVQAASGMVYAPKLEFEVTSAPPATSHTEVKRAMYVKPSAKTGIIPALTSPAYSLIGKIQIKDPIAAGKPEELPSALLFPQVLDSDLVRYQELAHLLVRNSKNELIPNPKGAGDPLIHKECRFDDPKYMEKTDYATHIFPPGYHGTKDPLDQYANHTDKNADHVYYCDDTINGLYVQGYIHGQILFVSEGPIRISSNIVSANEGYYTGTDTFLEGEQSTKISSSTANQAILITRQNVYIERLPGPPTSGAITHTIQAYIMAPHGKLIPSELYSSPQKLRLQLNFKGSLILQGVGAMKDVFQNQRTYAYMDTLKTHPAPYLPALSLIVASFEEVIGVNRP